MCYRYQLSRKYRQKIEKFISNFANEISKWKKLFISAKLVILVFLCLVFILNITLVYFAYLQFISGLLCPYCGNSIGSEVTAQEVLELRCSNWLHDLDQTM